MPEHLCDYIQGHSCNFQNTNCSSSLERKARKPSTTAVLTCQVCPCEGRIHGRTVAPLIGTHSNTSILMIT